MRLRELAIAAAVVTLPVGLTACGGASEEEFCTTYKAIYATDDEREEAGIDRVDEEDGLDELYGNVPDSADDEVKDAAEYLADNHSGSADLRERTDAGELSDAEQDRMFGALSTFASYGQETCLS